MKDLTQERLKELLTYKEDGMFINNFTRGRAKKHSIAGSFVKASPGHGLGYFKIMLDGKLYATHHLVWLYHTGTFPTDCIDHTDRDTTNNKISNLREATRSQNGFNRNLSSNNKSGYNGLHWCNTHNRWISQIRVMGVVVSKGYFKNKTLAIKKHIEESKRHHLKFHAGIEYKHE